MRPVGVARTAQQASVEDIKDEGHDVQREANPSPSSRATLAPDDDLIDVTDNQLQPAVSGVAADSASASENTSSELSSPRILMIIASDKRLDNVSLMKGSIQGPPAQVAAKVIHKYGSKFRQQVRETAQREGEEDIIVQERLDGVVRKVEHAKTLAQLVQIHKRNGERALITAHEMLEKEHKLYVKVTKMIQDLPKRAQFRKDFLVPQIVRVRNIETAMEFCEKLIMDVVEQPGKELRSCRVA